MVITARSDVIAIEWDDVPVSIQIDQDWQERADSHDLVAQALAQVIGHSELPLAGDWRSKLSLAGLDLHEMGRFAELLAAARAEAKQLGGPPPRQTKTRHFEMTWVADSPVELVADHDWIDQAARQDLADELLIVLTPPATDSAPSTPQRAELMAFLGVKP